MTTRNSLRRLSGTELSVLRFLGLGFVQGSSSPQRDELTKGTNGEPAVVPGVRVVLRGPITREPESDLKGVFAIDGLLREFTGSRRMLPASMRNSR